MPGWADRRTIVVLLSLLLLAGGAPATLSQVTATDALFRFAQQRALAQRLPAGTAASVGLPPDLDEAQPQSSPIPSGANPPYPLNHTFDAAAQPAGSPPTNHAFEVPGYAVGTPPANFDLEAAAQAVGTPPTNHDFESGDLSGWTTSGTVSIASDAPHGFYASLTGVNASITSAAFTVDATAQAFVFDLGLLATSGSTSAFIYVLTGASFETSTQVDSFSCTACGTWQLRQVNVVPYRGQTVKLKVLRTTGQVGLDNLTTQILFPDVTTSGKVRRVSEASGNDYAQLDSGGTLITSPFTVDSSAQFIAVKSTGHSGGVDQWRLHVLSGPSFTTETQVAMGTLPDAWTTVHFNANPWLGQTIKLKVAQFAQSVGVDDLGRRRSTSPAGPSPATPGSAATPRRALPWPPPATSPAAPSPSPRTPSSSRCITRV
jgi:hypothetical protein